MALPKKGSRNIVVDEVKYRWMGDAAKFEGDDFAFLFIELSDDPRQKIKASFSWTKLNAAYKKVNHKLSKVFDRPPSFVVRQTILYALENGWKPEEGGGVLDLGNLDDKLDYSQMKEQDN